MKRNGSPDVLPVLERYELKFVIPADMIEPISRFAAAYCSLDSYSAKSPDGFYRVNNLYFDTPHYRFLRNRLDGSENRFNMRVRTYSDSNPLPCFFEIKQKKVNIIRKYRARVTAEDWPRLLEGPPDEAPALPADGNRDLFVETAQRFMAAPAVLSQYLRRAYVSDHNAYARITFDTDLRYQSPEGYSLVPDEGCMTPLDNETIFDDGCSVVLELKCYTTQVPLWMIDLICRFDLRRRSFSKYVTGVKNVISLYSCDLFCRQNATAAFL